VFTFGDAPFLGAPVGAMQGDVVALLPVPGSYRLVTNFGAVLAPKDGGVRAASVSPAVIAAGVISGLNAYRVATGLQPLAVDAQLTGLAADWSRQMPAIGIQHRPLAAVLRQPAWFGYLRLGETIYAAPGFVTSGNVIAGWQGSPIHRETVLDPAFDSVGVGVNVSGGIVFVTADFAQRG